MKIALSVKTITVRLHLYYLYCTAFIATKPRNEYLFRARVAVKLVVCTAKCGIISVEVGMPVKNGERKETVPTSIRITPTCKRLWDALAQEMGVSNAALMEVLIREKAKAEGLWHREASDRGAALHDALEVTQ
jgi:hypothetical protein